MNSDDTNDDDLWSYVTKSVERLPAKHKNAPVKEDEDKRASPTSPSVKKAQRKHKKQYIAPAIPDRPPVKTPSKEIDRRTNEKLRRGQMKIEAQLDLHGMNQVQARQDLERFVESAYQQGFRCVLVITGKGTRRSQNADDHFLTPGVLRQNVPVWLSEGGMNEIVLQSHTAKTQDGGEGALYVLLRRRRS